MACEYLLQRLWDDRITGCIDDSLVVRTLLLQAQDLESDYQDQRQAADSLRSSAADPAMVSLLRDGLISSARNQMAPSRYISVPIRNKNWLQGFADVVCPSGAFCDLSVHGDRLEGRAFIADPQNGTHNGEFLLGEVKITPEPAERVIQQINYYRQYIKAREVIVLTDYEDAQLARMVQGSDISVFRLGSRFDDWCVQRDLASPSVNEM